jgi:hypothetical protein
MEKKVKRRLTLKLKRETLSRLDEPQLLLLAGGVCGTPSFGTTILPQTQDHSCKPGNHA